MYTSYSVLHYKGTITYIALYIVSIIYTYYSILLLVVFSYFIKKKSVLVLYQYRLTAVSVSYSILWEQEDE